MKHGDGALGIAYLAAAARVYQSQGFAVCPTYGGECMYHSTGCLCSLNASTAAPTEDHLHIDGTNLSFVLRRLLSDTLQRKLFSRLDSVHGVFVCSVSASNDSTLFYPYLIYPATSSDVAGAPLLPYVMLRGIVLLKLSVLVAWYVQRNHQPRASGRTRVRSSAAWPQLQFPGFTFHH